MRGYEICGIRAFWHSREGLSIKWTEAWCRLRQCTFRRRAPVLLTPMKWPAASYEMLTACVRRGYDSARLRLAPQNEPISA